MMLNPTQKSVWEKSFSNKLGRLAQGVGDRIKGTSTITFIRHSQVPPNKTPTYGRIVINHKPLKTEPNCTHLTVGGNSTFYQHDCSTPTANLPIIKMHLNSVVSIPTARYATADIKNFYLNNPLPDPEYMWLPSNIIPAEIFQQYKLASFNSNGKVYIKIMKGMYGLPQADKIANDHLQWHLRKYGYLPCHFSPGLWHHTDRKISFTLVIDDFGISYKNDEIYITSSLPSVINMKSPLTCLAPKSAASPSHGIMPFALSQFQYLTTSALFFKK